MRFSTSTFLLALPVLATAEGPFDQYKAQFQNFLSSFGSYIPKNAPAEEAAAAPGPEAAEEAKVGQAEVSVLTLNNWKDTLYSPVREGATVPEEWWVFVTGGNKTCKGFCGKAEAAYNETVQKFATIPNTPHMGYLNCEEENILCHSLGCGPGSLWVFEMLPPPAEISIYAKRLNLTSVESADLIELQASGSRKPFASIQGYFHPFNGLIAEYGLTVPVGYISWGFSLVPNWLFMFLLSMVSRMVMSKRMQGMPGGDGPAAAPAPAGGAAPAS